MVKRMAMPKDWLMRMDSDLVKLTVRQKVKQRRMVTGMVKPMEIQMGKLTVI